MPRPTNLGQPWPILRGLPGFDPDTPTGETPPPVDHADDALIEIPALVEETSVGDLNQPHGTLTDGGGTLAFANPTNANDGNDATTAVVGSYAGNGSTDYEAYLRSDLGASYTVYSMYARGDQDCSSPPHWYYQQSADGSTSWTTVSTTDTPTQLGPTEWTLESILDTPTSARYWRLVHDDGVHGGFRCGSFVGTWEIRGAVVTSSEIVWVQAFAANDNSDATSDYVAAQAIDAADGVILRMDLS
jgi:hypothetical protein